MLHKGLIFFTLLLTYFINIVSAQKQATHTFYFATDSSKLTITEISKFNDFLKSFDAIAISNISILGYTDDIGRIGYNDTLSTKRANTIKNMLMSYEVDNHNIKMIAGKGKLPLTRAKSIENQRFLNRKVEVIIEYQTKPLNAKRPLLSIDTLKVGDKIVLENILFENSRHQFLPESFETLEALTRTLKAKPKISVAILGHICCNEPGKDIRDFDTGEYNLSFARARVVYEYFVKNGIDPNRMTYKGMMANFPLGKGDKNDRRVELQVTSISK